MAMHGLNLTKTFEYVSNLDPAKGTPTEKSDATIWKLGTLDSRVMGYLRDMSTKFTVSQANMTGENNSVETSVSQSEQDFETVRFGLKGWTNFKDEDENDIKFETKTKMLAGSGKSYQAVTPELVSMIPGELITELATRIRSGQEVEVAAKND